MKHVTIPAQWLQELIALCGPEDHELRERVMKSAAPAPADPLATATGLTAQEVDQSPVAWRYQTSTGWHATTDAAAANRVRAHHTVEPLYAAPQQADARDALTQAELLELRRAADDFDEGCDTDVEHDLLARGALAGYLHCERFVVLDGFALDAAIAAAKGE